MPEIAEVEISRRQCLHLVGKRLEEVVVFDQKIDDNFQTLLDSSLTDVLRCGKRLGLIFNNQAIIIQCERSMLRILLICCFAPTEL